MGENGRAALASSSRDLGCVPRGCPLATTGQGQVRQMIPVLPRDEHHRRRVPQAAAKAAPQQQLERELQPPVPDAARATHRRRARLLHELRQAGLSDADARAEASRLLAGDIWAG